MCCFFAVSAHAALEPRYYEEARQNADSVVVVRVERVAGLPFWRGYGDCRVTGRIEAVERGSRYAIGERIVIATPCHRAGAEMPTGGVQYKEHGELRRSRWGRAWLEADGSLALYQYDILAAAP
jgi:hypothetical protein